MDWLANMEKALDDKQPVHGDLDTVVGLVEQHKNFEEELNSRTEQVEQLKQTAEELLRMMMPSRLDLRLLSLQIDWKMYGI